jgi:predicted O-linked N-acetylglucosamine transferase (SPINDLY family)
MSVPPDPAASLGQAVALHQQGRLEEAAALYRAVLAAAPDNPDALHLLGVTLLQRQDFAAAAESIGRSVVLRPVDPAAQGNLGTALLQLGRDAEALAALDCALALKPDYAEALNNRGLILARLHRPAEALACYERALALRPDYGDALKNRGTVLRVLGRPAEAVESYSRAMGFRPDDLDLVLQRAETLRDLKRNEEAARDFETLQRREPRAMFVMGEIRLAKNNCCDWPDYDAEIARILDRIRAGWPAATPFPVLSFTDDPALQRRAAEIYGATKIPQHLPPLWQGERYGHDRIRIAYLSADFHEHATAYLMAELFERHDRSRFEITALSFGPDGKGPMRARLVAAFDRFVDIRTRTDQEAAALLRQLEIDIVVDLKGHTGGARQAILAHRPAPVQVNYLGYPGTMALPQVDYILADRFIIPESHEGCYAEQVACLPDCYQPNDTRRAIAERRPSRAEAGLPDNGFVFCSFNNTYKLAPHIFAIWMRLLCRVEGSVLWLLGSSEAAARNLRREAAAQGVPPERLVFAPRLALPEHLARHRLADLFLDTQPYGAHTTTSDALWAGLPVLTCPGESFAARVAGSLVRTAGLPELVVPDLDAYEALALALAQDPARLAALKQRLATEGRSSPLFDTDRFRRHLESAYEIMWARAEQGKAPAGFVVPAEPA